MELAESECSCGECDLDNDEGSVKTDLFSMIEQAVRNVLEESKPVPEATEKPKRPSRTKKQPTEAKDV